MLNNLRKQIILFISSQKNYPIIAAIASGLYPMLYYYNSNFTLVNSWSQFWDFGLYFILLPTLLFYFTYAVITRSNFFKGSTKFVISILNICCFLILIVISTYGFKFEYFIVAILIGIAAGILFHKQTNKIIVFQFLLAFIVGIMLLPDVYKHLTYSTEWTRQLDNIESVKFKNKPNIYIIQPDGYANFSELKKGNYNFDNKDFEEYLNTKNFSLYDNYRSNYVSTLSSNSSMFAMKHHYYNNTTIKSNELYNSRQIIAGKNPFISILKSNGYKTFLLLERPYVLLNRPEQYYDYCNYSYDEISFLSRGFDLKKDVIQDLKSSIGNNQNTSNFFFICGMDPSHVSIHKNESRGKNGERDLYLNALKSANEWIKQVINVIQDKDENSLIVIAADHGGYVGLEYSMENRIKQTDRDIIYSIYTSALAIKWSHQEPSYARRLKTPVNLFRILCSYLSENLSYLDNLQPDKSFALINKGAPYGVYEYINEKGETVFKKYP